MSTELKIQRMRFVSGTDTFVLRTIGAADPNSPPQPSEPAGSIVRSTDGLLWRNTNGSTTWERLGGDVTALSGTINARFVNLSGTVDGHFNQLSGTIDARFVNFATVTGTLQITSSSMPSTNISNEGNVDFLMFSSFLNPPRAGQANSTQSKRGGGWLREGFDWVFAGNSLTADTTAFGGGATTTATTTIANSIVTASTTKARMFSLSSPTNGWGWTLTIPAVPQMRYLRITGGQFSNVVVISASLSDGSAANVSCNHSTGPSGGGSWQTMIAFNSSKNCDLTVTATVVARYTTDPNISVGWLTLSQSNI